VRVVLVLLAVVGCVLGGKHYLYKRSLSGSQDLDFLSSLGLGSSAERSSWPPGDWSPKLPRPSWGTSPPPDAATAEAAAKALKGTRAGR
jgi:hypothetical protein